MDVKGRLIELLLEPIHIRIGADPVEAVADYLLDNGVAVLPCNVDDTLYVISQMKDKRILPFINEYKVTSILLKKKSISIYHEKDGFVKTFKPADFGKTVFLTKEAAEQALKSCER